VTFRGFLTSLVLARRQSYESGFDFETIARLVDGRWRKVLLPASLDEFRALNLASPCLSVASLHLRSRHVPQFSQVASPIRQSPLL
jgi:hypothetical protein